MLDKSVPYFNIIMRRAADAPLPQERSLPEGYALRLYREGDARHWARIEASADEFPDAQKAEAYYAEFFLPTPDELPRRALFALAPDGLPVGTATAWFTDAGERYGCLHWVAVDPAHQGKGVGRALVTAALRLFRTLEAGCDVFLHTQTWSWPAVKLYDSLGFRVCRTDTFAMRHPTKGGARPAPNDYARAMAVLATRLPAALLERMRREAV